MLGQSNNSCTSCLIPEVTDGEMHPQHLACGYLSLAARVHIYMTDRSEERNAGRQEMNDCMSECRNAILLWESHPMAGLIMCQWVAFGWHPRILGRSWREGMASRLQTDIHTSTHTVIQTDRHTWLHTYIPTDILTCKQSVPRQASNQALGLWKLLAMLWKLQQNRHFASLEAGLETGLEAMEIAIGCYGNCSKGETWLNCIDAMESALG